MFNNLKSAEFFNPDKLHGEIHIAGCGAVGGSVAEVLTRTGITKIHLWDMDTVCSHNLGNQVFFSKHVDKPKTEALKEILLSINPELQVITHKELTTSERISGYIFLCIDNIDVRRALCTKWKNNPNVLFVIDGRMRLTDGTIHAADWNKSEQINALLNSMDFTHEEALANTPVSACGLTLSVVCTPRVLAALMVSNFIKFINLNQCTYFTEIDAYSLFLESYVK